MGGRGRLLFCAFGVLGGLYAWYCAESEGVAEPYLGGICGVNDAP